MKMRGSNIGPTHTILVLVLGCGGFISAADNWIVAPILPSIAEGLHVSVAQTALILAAYMIPYGIMQPVHGHVSEAYGRLWLLRRLVLGLAVGTLGCSLSPSFAWLCVFRAVTGFFAAGLIAVSLALIGDRVPLPMRQFYVGRFMGIVFLGQALSAALGGFLAQYVSWRIIFVLLTGMALLVFVLLLRLRISSPRKPLSNFLEQLALVMSSRKGRSIYILAFVAGYLLLGIYGFVGAFLQQEGGIGPLQAGGVLMLFGFASLAAGSSMGQIARKTGRRGVAVTGAALGFLAAVLLVFSADWKVGALAMVMLGFGYVLVQSTLATLAFEVGASGLSSGLVGLGLFGGGGVSSAVGSLILVHYGYEFLWCVSMSGAALLTLAFLKVRAAFAPEPQSTIHGDASSGSRKHLRRGKA